MSLKQLHREFIEKANRPMSFGSLPVTAKQSIAPLIPVERWSRFSDGSINKTYRFREMGQRDRFVVGLLSYESHVEHNAKITIDHDVVSVSLVTKDLGKATELDMEYARYADVLHKDIAYSPSHGDDC